MQSSDGSMKTLTTEKVKNNHRFRLDPKVISTGEYFKIKQCYFKIVTITTEGLIANGVSRREYFENRA